MPGRRQASLGGVVFSTSRTFLADNAGIGLPLGIERVIRIGSKYGIKKILDKTELI
jgi:hypothetical protein